MAWTCPKCERVFGSPNQSHFCTTVTIDDLFVGKPENLLSAFDQVLIAVYDWPDVNVGAAKRAIVFSVGKAFLIARPMSKELDLCFYSDQALEDRMFHKSGKYGKKYFYHIRIKHPDDVTPALLKWIRHGYEFCRPKNKAQKK